MNDILEYKGYSANVNFDAEKSFYYGKLAAIDDLVSFEGETAREIETAFHEAVNDYLQTCEELNKRPF